MQTIQNVYKLGHHPIEDGAGMPGRFVLIVAEDLEQAIGKFRKKYPNSTIESDLEKIGGSYVEEVIQ